MLSTIEQHHCDADMKTLLLNIGYEPIGLISWQEAIVDWYLDKVEILAGYDGVPVRSTYVTMKMPAVVRLKHRHHQYNPEAVPLERRYVLARDGFACQYCGQKFPDDLLTYDHIVPRCRGGKTTWTNIVTACTTCNNRKDDRTPQQADMPLLRKPKKPKWMPAAVVDAIASGSVPLPWRDWIGWIRELSYS